MRPYSTALGAALVLAACGASAGTPEGETAGTGDDTVEPTAGDAPGPDPSADATAADDDDPATGGDGTTSGGTTDGGVDTTGVAPTCELTESGPIVVRANDQVIENVHIVAQGGPGITIDGFTGVRIQNVWIEHEGGAGIEVLNGADDTAIIDVSVTHTGAPAAGENPSDELLNVVCYGSARLSVTNARLVRGSSGIYLVECPGAALTGLEGHDFRGPFPRGQLVQFDKSDGGVLEDFSVVNPPDTSWPEDDVNVYQSVDIEIRRGLVDGNNSPSGVGVIFDGDLALGVVEDVDAIRMGNGCFSDYAGSDGVIFRRTRCRENICEDQGRGPPL